MKVIYKGGNIGLTDQTALARPHPSDKKKLLLQFDNTQMEPYYGPTGSEHCSEACTAPRTCHNLAFGWHEFYKKDLLEYIVEEKEID